MERLFAYVILSKYTWILMEKCNSLIVNIPQISLKSMCEQSSRFISLLFVYLPLLPCVFYKESFDWPIYFFSQKC